MKTFITLLFSSFLTNHCLAQMDSTSVTDKKIISKIVELKSRKIDTLLSYYVYCSGIPPRIVANDTSCYTYDIKYLFWIDKGKCLMQRFDECGEHKELPVTNALFNLIHIKHWLIAKEKIRSPEYVEIIKGKKTSYSVMQDHDCFSIFQIHIKNKVIRKEVNNFDVDSKYDHNLLNRNYYYNQHLSVNTLKKLVERQIAYYNHSK